MTAPTVVHGNLVRRSAPIALRFVTAAGLVVDAVVHLRMTGEYNLVGDQITVGMLFRAEAAGALFAAILVLLSSRWFAAMIAAVVAASAVLALLISVYWDIGPIGPFPDVYEPIWFTQKVIALIAESASLLTALLAMAVAAPWLRADRRRSGRRP
ncbi:MAG TPA: hypothetical protein VGL05_27070 [Kribbella sp.]